MKISSRGFLIAACICCVAANARSLELSSATIGDLNCAFANGSLTSETLVRLYLARIEAYDKQGPALNTILTLNPKALEEARALDVERKTKGPRSMLHGIPVVLKDLYDVAGIQTTAGFIGLKGSTPWRDGWVAQRLKASGAIILAKTNLDDWFADAPDGASTLGGQMRNPYNLKYTPGGSSGGTGAALAAWFATVGFGSETGVSIRNPTSENCLVGLAPTYGLISRRGMIMSAVTHERSGPMARNLFDLTVALTAVAGFDPEDLATMAARGRIPAGGYTQYLAPQNGLRGARIGVLRQMFRNGPDHKEGRVIIERAIAELKNAGAIVCDPVNTGLPLFSLLREARVSDWEKKSATDLYLAGLGPNAKYRSLVDMIQQNSALLKNLAPMARVGRLDFDPAYLARLKTREELQKAISSLMDQYKLDAIVYPFKTIQATQIGAKRRDDADNALSSQTGFPALVLPAGFFSNGLPIAIEFLGRPFSEPVLLRLGSAYEECSHHHSPPAATPPLPGELIGG